MRGESSAATSCSAYQVSAARCSVAARGKPRRSGGTSPVRSTPASSPSSAGGSLVARRSRSSRRAWPAARRGRRRCPRRGRRDPDGGAPASTSSKVRSNTSSGRYRPRRTPMWSPRRRRPASGTPTVVAPLPSRRGKTSLRPRQPAAGQRAVAERGDQPRLGPGPGRRVAGGDVLSGAGRAGGALELPQQPLRPIDHGRCRHLVAHGPLAPQVLVPLQGAGHGGRGGGQVGQGGRALERRHRALRTHEVHDGELARLRDPSSCPRGRRRDP